MLWLDESCMTVFLPVVFLGSPSKSVEELLLSLSFLCFLSFCSLNCLILRAMLGEDPLLPPPIGFVSYLRLLTDL